MVACLGMLRPDGRVAWSDILLTLSRQPLADNLWLTNDFDIVVRQDVIELADSLVRDVIVCPPLLLRKQSKQILQKRVFEQCLNRLVLWGGV